MNHQAVNVQLECVCPYTHPGQSVWVVGNVPVLGSWDIHRGVQLSTAADQYPKWRLGKNGIRVPKSQDVEFKFVIMSEKKDYVNWEQISNNRVIKTDTPLLYRCDFGDWQSETSSWTPPSSSKHLSVDLANASLSDTPQQPGAAKWMGRSDSSSSSPLHRLSSGLLDILSSSSPLSGSVSTPSLIGSSAYSPPSVASRIVDASSPLGGGKEDEEDQRRAAGAGVAGGSYALRMLVDGDREAKSWREKLEVVRRLLLTGFKDGKFRSQEDTVTLIDCLSYAGIYLRFISQGDIPCGEDGRHYRPNHHANISKELCCLLEQVMLEVSTRDDLLADAIRILARFIAPSLPSFSAAFTAAQPLTRIRDIAHRNDIPMELKNEIKHSLQNKLHRCAGPEDLETAERLLHRFNSNPGAYSHDFILEFERFYDELKRFFNATDLEQRLRELRYQSNPRVAELIDRFLESKARCDDSTASLTKLLVALSVCLELRISLTCQLKDSGLISSSSTYRGQDLHQIQDLRLAEILLEDVAFLLLSRVENLLQDDPDDGRWPEAIEALCLAVHDVKISGIRRDECRALGSELSAHTRRASQMNEDWLMLKATLERCRRLCEDFTDLQIVLYSGRALALGNELKLPEHAVRVFSEATIRSSVVFQISKLCGDLLRRVRSILELQPYDALVCGEAVGEVRLYDTLEEGVLQCIRLNPSNIANERGEAFYSHHLNALNGDTSEERKKTGEDGNKDTNKTEKKKNRNVSDINEEDNAAPAIILAARCATGDEEVAGLDGPHGKVVGIVVGHDLPILSHLGVRARQRGGPFVACQEPGAFEPFVAAQGKVLSLSANSHSVTFEVLEGQKASDALELQRQRKTSQNMTGGRGAGRGAGFSGRSDEMVASMKMKDPSSFSSSDGGVSSPNYPFSSVISSSLLQDSSSPPSPLHIHDMRVEDCGAKASTCAMLRILCEESGGGADFSPSSSPSSFVDGMHANHHSTSPPPVFQAARCLAYRFGTMEWLIENQNQTEEFQKLIETMEKASPGPELDEATSQMQELILNLVLPEELLTPVVDLFGGLRSRLVVRSSANVEDLEGMSAAGLYESVANVSLGDGVAFQSAVVTVWASLYSRRAILARRAAGIPQHQACMAVLIQELVTPEYSFILHTVNPVDTQDVNHLYVEMAPGLGEVLAGGQTRGSPHRMLVNKSTGELTMLAFCNYSNALVPVMPRSKSFSTLRDGKAGQHAVASTSPSNLIKSKVMDYTMDILTQDTGYRVHIAHKLADVSVVLEAKLGGPQDVEGVASGDTIWIVQSRPQSM